MHHRPFKTATAFIVTLALSALLPLSAFADGQGSEYCLGEPVNAGFDTGFSESNPIEKDDPHFGWKLGTFLVSGHTSVVGGETPVFLKNAGDTVALSFELNQNTDALNGNDRIVIAEDTKGYDEYFGIPETNFGRGVLIVRHTDHQNASQEPVQYANYLAGIEAGSNTEIGLYDEGDYEVALNYEIESPGILGQNIFPDRNNYRIFFKFKVRNSNTMAFLFDSGTNNELFNGSVTQNGFRLDLAGSHYLNVNIKKELLNNTGNGLVEDTRFNKSARDGDTFTDPGIYTVTITNPNTEETPTTKRIYVGSDEVLMASVANSMTIDEVKEALAQGQEVSGDGTLIKTEASEPAKDAAGETSQGTQAGPLLPVAAAIALAAIVAVLVIAMRRKKTSQAKTSESEVESSAEDSFDEEQLETTSEKVGA